MTDKNVFRSKTEELEKLTHELSELKVAIKEISSAMARIERHVKRSFGITPKTKARTTKARSSNKGAKGQETPSITPDQALELFDELSVKWDRETPQAVETQLQSMDVVDLKLLAHELGVTYPTKPSKKSLYSGIIGRLNERAMLSRNINTTPSKRRQMEGDKKVE